MKSLAFFFFIFLTLCLNAKSKPKIEWVKIPAGTFIMGSPESETGRTNNETQHEVTLSAFIMSKYEITFDQYDPFCDATGRKKPDDEKMGRGNRPVINISWNDAKAYAEWMGCRLPTEAEWEYACRAGTTTPFYVGNTLTIDQANYNPGAVHYNKGAGFRNKTMPVGSFSPNNWGLYDTMGNVWEWCSDFYGAYEKTPQNNPQGPATGQYRILRGGSWALEESDRCRSAYRYYAEATTYLRNFGIRLVNSK